MEGPDGHKIPIINAYESLKLLAAPPAWAEPIIISPTTTRAGISMPDVGQYDIIKT